MSISYTHEISVAVQHGMLKASSYMGIKLLIERYLCEVHSKIYGVHRVCTCYWIRMNSGKFIPKLCSTAQVTYVCEAATWKN